MSLSQILLICGEEDLVIAREKLAQVKDKWPVDCKPECKVINFDEIHTMTKPLRPTVAWIYADAHKLKTDVYLALDAVEQWFLPTLFTRSEELLPNGSLFRDGVIIGSNETDTESLRMMLMGLVSQVGMLRQISTELMLTQRQNAGMQSEFSRIEEELRMAASLQKEFLPSQFPKGDACEFKVLYRPANYVSGDIYDIRQVDADHIAFYLADAVGHGVPAALMTIFIRHTLLNAQVTWVENGVITPDRAMAELNRQMLKRQQNSVQFATACYALLNTKTGELQFARAGHPPAFWLKGNGEVVDIAPDGPLLGVFEEYPFEVQTIKLEPGDRFLLYTDGFEMAFGTEESVVNEDYIQELHKLREGEMMAAMRTLTDKIDNHAGSLHQRDDLTAIAVGYREVRAKEGADDVVVETRD